MTLTLRLLLVIYEPSDDFIENLSPDLHVSYFPSSRERKSEG